MITFHVLHIDIGDVLLYEVLLIVFWIIIIISVGIRAFAIISLLPRGWALHLEMRGFEFIVLI